MTSIAMEATTGQVPLETFEAFCDRMYERTMQFASLVTSDPATAEDAVQDAFGSLLPRFDRVASPEAYLRVSLVNAVRRRGSKLKRERLVHRALIPATGCVDSIDELSASIGRLPIKERTAIVCRYWADMPEDEIAEVLQVRPSTVRTLIHRAAKRLRLEVEQ